jgi:hypothetical protein
MLSSVSALILGCTASLPNPDIIGLDRARVIEKLGQPNRESAKNDGVRLDYSRGPDGLNTYFVYLDRSGKVKDYKQVLSDSNFARIAPGMTRAEVIEIIGDAPKQHLIARDRGYVWSYRSFSTVCIWFQVEFSLEDIVRSTGYNRRPTGMPCR